MEIDGVKITLPDDIGFIYAPYIPEKIGGEIVMSSISFIGTSGGDCECFCWFVSKEEYIKIKGQEDYDNEIRFTREFAKDLGKEYIEADICWSIYPSDLLTEEVKESQKKFKYTLVVEEV